MVRVSVTTLLLTALASVAHGEVRQFGNVIYTIPQGWTEGARRDGYQIFLSDLPEDVCEFCYLYLGTGAPAKGSLGGFVGMNLMTFIDPEDRQGWKPVGKADSFSTGKHTAMMQGITDGSSILVLVGIDTGERYEIVGFQGGGSDEDEVRETLGTFGTSGTAFMDSFRFVSDGAPSLLPAATPGDLDGIYWGWSTYTTLGLDMMMRIEMDYRSLFFWPDGHFYDGTPPNGVNPIDRDALVAKSSTEFGVYTHNGTTLNLIFADGKTETLTAEGDGWKDGSKSLSPTDTLADGATIDGSVSSFFYTGFTPGAGIEGGISAGSETVFHPDGTYEGSSYGGAFGNFDAGGGYATSHENADGGTYVIRDGLLISTPDGGGPPVAALALQVDDGILIGDQFLDTAE
jgi:hypothetical protein